MALWSSYQIKENEVISHLQPSDVQEGGSLASDQAKA